MECNRSPRRAAVLLILYPRNGEPCLVLTRRTEQVADHKGQICFPGGAVETADSSELEAALREAQEELGIDPAQLRVLCALEPVHTVATNYVIAPFVAYASSRPAFRPAEREVAELIEVPVAALLDPAALTVERWDTHGVQRDVYFYRFGEHIIWGATARIVKQFLDRCYSREWWERTLANAGH